MKTKKIFFIFGMLTISLLAFGLLNLSLGSVSIPFKDVINSFINPSMVKDTYQYTIIDYRLPKTFTAIIVGSGLGISGLLMQTLFRNGLAGPFVLGISSGASLGVGLLILGGSIFGGTLANISGYALGTVLAASIGAFMVLLLVMLIAQKVKNTYSLLIIGLMLGSITSAIISVFAYFSSAEHLQQYIFWSFGSLGNLDWSQLGILFLVYFIGLSFIPFLIKPLNALLLGENYAKSIGINFSKTKNIILLSTSIITGVITAFAGPIAFIGLAVPHIAKLVFTTANHKIMLPACFFIGAIVMLISDTIAQLPTSAFTLPINTITSLFGAPIVIWLLMKKR